MEQRGSLKAILVDGEFDRDAVVYLPYTLSGIANLRTPYNLIRQCLPDWIR